MTLRHTLAASARASWGTGSFAISATSQQYERVSLSSDSAVFYVQARRRVGRVAPRNGLTPKPEFQALLDEGRNAEFLNRCGSAYIGQQVNEVNFTVLYRFSDVSAAKRSELTRAFGLSFTQAGFGTDLKAQWLDAVTSVSDMSQVDVEVSSKGGNAAAVNDLYSCLLKKNLYDLAVVREECLAPYVDALEASDGVPVSYNAGSMTVFGLNGCFQQGLRNRDAKLAAIHGEFEDVKATVAGLTALKAEVDYGLIPQVANETSTLSSRVDAAKNQFVGYGRQLECLATQCVRDAANNFDNCRTPDEAQVDPPPGCTLGAVPLVPQDIVDLLYEQARYSFHRWCALGQIAARDQGEGLGPAQANTVKAVADAYGASAASINCQSLSKRVSEDGVDGGRLTLTGYPSGAGDSRGGRYAAPPFVHRSAQRSGVCRGRGRRERRAPRYGPCEDGHYSGRTGLAARGETGGSTEHGTPNTDSGCERTALCPCSVFRSPCSFGSFTRLLMRSPAARRCWW